MFEFTESRLQFNFGEPWAHVCQWDEHPAFVRGLQQHPTTQGVDFLGLYGSDPYFIEVKNFRDYRIKNKKRLTSGDLVAEVADKVRDTVAGLAWANGRGLADARLTSLLDHLFAVKTTRHVVLWLEEDPHTRPADRSALAEAIKRRLGWLHTRAIVRSRRDPPMFGLAVTGVSREA